MAANLDVIDITPEHEPIALARKMEAEAIGARAGVAILIGEDGELWYRMAGRERAYIMWALQRMVHMLMDTEPEPEREESEPQQ